jgi:lipoprotein-anchoring transpeptidase ErfK/SrfK
MSNCVSIVVLSLLIIMNISCNANNSKKQKLAHAIENTLQDIASTNNDIVLSGDTVISIIKIKKQIDCAVWANVSLAEQKLYLYENGILIDTFKISSGDRKHKTPSMDRKFTGRMYKKYTSKKFPGGNYMGLGNMPYVMFIRGGYAIHGTTPGNFALLGKPASHGCIRLHPDHAKVFYELIEKNGVENVWITVVE